MPFTESSHVPLLFYMDRIHDCELLRAFRAETPHTVVDFYREQLEELCAVRNPHLRDDREALKYLQGEFIQAHVVRGTLEESGVWVWYPWKSTLVHSLPPKEFEELRTARNRDLITSKEQELFSNCAVGIAGLSVGSHAAISLALQGGCKRMHLADADTVSGSNLNRIRAGIDTIGLNKAVLVARQIYEMNPYAELTLFTEGLNEQNAEEFFGQTDQINVFIDEMDNLKMKLHARKIARERGTPVISAADNGDGVIVDIERYDEHSDLPFFLGRVSEDDPELWRMVPRRSEEIAELITRFIGREVVEPRMVDSVTKVGTALYSWPQLGGTANLSGIVLAYIVREISCQRKVHSGRFLFSIGQIFNTLPDLTKYPEPAITSSLDIKQNQDALSVRSAPIVIDGDSFTIKDVVSVAREQATVMIDENSERRMRESRSAVDRWTSEGRIMYGITTGFGSMASTLIPPAYQQELQENLIRSHASNVGPALPKEEVRAALTLRLNALAKGVSGISLETAHLLKAMLNQGVHPLVPQFGSVGASGDLNPLSHIALAAIGEGLSEFKGEIMPSRDALKRAGLSPVTLRAKEGLALINGTSVMTGIGALACYDLAVLIKSAEIITSLTMEALHASLEPYEEFGQVMKPHPGQLRTAANIRTLLQGSHLVSDGDHVREFRKNLQSTLQKNGEVTHIERAVQDAYSIRAVSQVLGASRDALEYVSGRLTTEMNSASDNPLVFSKEDAIFQGANFHGATVALPLDVLTISAIQVGILSERQLNRLLNRHLSNGLPAFLARGNVGLRCGFAGAQYVSTSLVAECRTMAIPASIQSVPSNEDNQDVVSMGLIGARKARDIIGKIEYILAVELLAVCEALEEREKEKMSPITRAAYESVRSQIPAYDVDRPMTPDFEKTKRMIHGGKLVKVVEERGGKL